MPLQKLSKIEFFSGLDPENIPLFILLETLNSYPEPLPETISNSTSWKRIQILSQTTIIYPHSQEDLRLLARFMNPNVQGWSQSSLTVAYNFHQACKQKQFRRNLFISGFTQIGLPTPECPTSLCGCILLALCKDLNIRIHPNLTLHNVYSEVYKESIKVRPLKPIQEFDPAIKEAAKKFQVDLTMVQDPEQELERLNSDKFPTDLNFIYMCLNLNCQPYLEETFNPNLPCEFYTKDALVSLGTKIGLYEIPTNLHILYDKICLNWEKPRFYSGKATYTSQIETLYTLEPLDDLSHSDCLSYGQEGSGFTVYTFEELTKCFDMYKNLCLPSSTLTPVELTSFDVLSLIDVCSKSTSTFASDCLKCVREIQSFFWNRFERTQILSQFVSTCSQDELTQVQACLTKLYDLSMSMRTTQTSDTFDCDITLNFIEFEKAIELAKHSGKMILNLPLLRFETTKWKIGTRKDEGLTILDRLTIVKQGQTEDSCVRISSNWLASTAWYYMFLIGMPVPIRIQDLETLT